MCTNVFYLHLVVYYFSLYVITCSKQFNVLHKICRFNSLKSSIFITFTATLTQTGALSTTMQWSWVETDRLILRGEELRIHWDLLMILPYAFVVWCSARITAMPYMIPDYGSLPCFRNNKYEPAGYFISSVMLSAAEVRLFRHRTTFSAVRDLYT
jgi:hypothetical protein